MGGLLGVMPGYLIIGLVTWSVIFFSTRYVALASIGFGVSLPVCTLVNTWMYDQPGTFEKVVFSLVVMLWIVWRHRSNISRLRNGTENRFQKKSKKCREITYHTTEITCIIKTTKRSHSSNSSRSITWC